MSAVTKEARARRVMKHPLPVRKEPRNDGPLLRAALQWAYFHAYGNDGRPDADPEKIRVRFAALLGVDVSTVGHAERRRPCVTCDGYGDENGKGGCRRCGGSGNGDFDFVQLPDEPNDGKPVAPIDRLTFFAQCPDVASLPAAPERWGKLRSRRADGAR